MPCPPPVTTTLAAASSGACRPGPAQAHGGSSPAFGENRVAASRTPRRPASAASSSPVAPTEAVDSEITTSGSVPGGGGRSVSAGSQSTNGPTMWASGGQSGRGCSSAGSVATSRSAGGPSSGSPRPVSYTHLRAHETVLDLVCRLLLEKT